jgi:HprK-related kinase A
MTVRDALRSGIDDRGIFIQTGPFVVHLRTRIKRVIDGVACLYPDYPTAPGTDFADFHIELAQPNGLRRWYRPQVNFALDGQVPFLPLPLDQALPMLEWGLNWAIANYALQYLIIHAAAIEKDGLAAILPAPPGSGKSTLCAALVHRGWRLLSDEMALLCMQTGNVIPVARPISLKNESIDVIRGYADGTIFSAPARDTAKGTVALLKAPTASVRRAGEPARPAWVVVPKFVRGVTATLTPKSRAETFIELGQNAFNYSVHGAKGFKLLARVMDGCDCFQFQYSKLDDAVAAFASLRPRPNLAH